MHFITDLHAHSRFSRACSKELTLPNIAKWCEIKGINIVGTGDFTFPRWFEEIKEQLEETGDGIFKLNGSPSATRFLLTTELSAIYKQGDKVRRVHLCVFLPSILSVEKLIDSLEAHGANLKSDGRPILGLSAKEITKLVLDADARGLVVPAHCWTPWFAVFGSKSGFDSLEECFEEMTPYIHAVETGLSSDPPMNWRISGLDSVLLLSNSDAHSLRNLGREANVFEADSFDYETLHSMLVTRDKKRFLYTIEFHPEEGMYHYDGHRVCYFSCTPAETKNHDGICPSCKKPLVIGVMNRVEMLANRPEGAGAKGKVPFKYIVPLEIVIGEALGRQRGTKGVTAIYEKLIREIGNEFSILLDMPYDEISRATLPEVVEAIRRMREGKLIIKPGYDGVYGTVKIFSPEERKKVQQAILW